jgi:5-methylcytosine-specific restriction endonuclease McrA
MQCGVIVQRTEAEISRRSGRVFCSGRCRAKWQFGSDKTLHPRWKGGDKDLSCETCHQAFTVERWMNRRFCSTKCHKVYLSEVNKTTLVCLQCGCGFRVNPSGIKRNRKFCSLSCNAINRDLTGAKNNRWKGGISSERDTVKATEEYKQWRLAVYRRDHFMCVVCLDSPTKDKRIEAHHLKKFSDYPELAVDLDNGCTLCTKCHKQTYQAEELFENFLRNRILRDFTSDTRIPLDIVKIKSGLHGDMQRSAEMTDPAYIEASA